MPGSDLPSGGSGAPPPPSSPPRSGKRKRKAIAAAAGTSTPRRATRSSARQAVDLDGAVRWARSAAAGMLWARRVRDLAGVEEMWELILEVRRARFVLEPDDPDSPYPKKHKILRPGIRSSMRVACQVKYLSDHPKKRVGVDPVEYQAFVPEWENAPSEEDTANYKAETIQKLGTMVCQPNMDISATDETEKMMKASVDECNCSHPGSEACVQVHVRWARSSIKSQLGEEAFRNCGLDAMGDQVLQLWTAADQNKLDDIEKMTPQDKHGKFMKIASKQFGSDKTKDLAMYYYNVFLLRRLASLTRAEPKNDKDVDTDNGSLHDDNSEHCSEDEDKSSRSSSERLRK